MHLSAYFRVGLHGLVGFIYVFIWFPNTATCAEFVIDPSHTVADFEVRYLGLFTQQGKFNRITGVIGLNHEASKGSMEIVIDARSLTADSERREKFLRGPDVFNVEQFPEIRYVADSVTFTDGKPEHVHGNLTLLGVTKPVQLEVTYYRCAEASETTPARCEFGALATIHRSEFGMTKIWRFVSDTAKLLVKAEADQVPIAK